MLQIAEKISAHLFLHFKVFIIMQELILAKGLPISFRHATICIEGPYSVGYPK